MWEARWSFLCCDTKIQVNYVCLSIVWVYLQNSILSLLIPITTCLASCHCLSPDPLVPPNPLLSVSVLLFPHSVGLDSSCTLWDSVLFLMMRPCWCARSLILNSYILSWLPVSALVFPFPDSRNSASWHGFPPTADVSAWILSYHLHPSQPHSCPCLPNHLPFAKSP